MDKLDVVKAKLASAPFDYILRKNSDRWGALFTEDDQYFTPRREVWVRQLSHDTPLLFIIDTEDYGGGDVIYDEGEVVFEYYSDNEAIFIFGQPVQSSEELAELLPRANFAAYKLFGATNEYVRKREEQLKFAVAWGEKQRHETDNGEDPAVRYAPPAPEERNPLGFGDLWAITYD